MLIYLGFALRSSKNFIIILDVKLKPLSFRRNSKRSEVYSRKKDSSMERLRKNEMDMKKKKTRTPIVEKPIK